MSLHGSLSRSMHLWSTVSLTMFVVEMVMCIIISIDTETIAVWHATVTLVRTIVWGHHLQRGQGQLRLQFTVVGSTVLNTVGIAAKGRVWGAILRAEMGRGSSARQRGGRGRRRGHVVGTAAVHVSRGIYTTRDKPIEHYHHIANQCSCLVSIGLPCRSRCALFAEDPQHRPKSQCCCCACNCCAWTMSSRRCADNVSIDRPICSLSNSLFTTSTCIDHCRHSNDTWW